MTTMSEALFFMEPDHDKMRAREELETKNTGKQAFQQTLLIC